MRADVMPGKTIAIFDLDDTLIKGDSFLPFLAYAAGWPRTLLALTEGALRYPFHLAGSGIGDGGEKGPRTFLKSLLLKRLLAGRRADAMTAAAEKLHKRVTWIATTRDALMDHHAKGHHIVIASGALDLYVPVLLRDIPYDAILCATVGIENGIVTGIMTAGNPVRQRKAERVAEYLAEHGPFEDSYGYGNVPHDIPMLELVRHRVIV